MPDYTQNFETQYEYFGDKATETETLLQRNSKYVSFLSDILILLSGAIMDYDADYEILLKRIRTLVEEALKL